MNKPNKEQIHGVIGTVVFHAIVLVILLLVVISQPQQQQEAGVAVIMGNVEAAAGDAYRYTEVKVQPQPSKPASQPASSPEEPLITQNDEPSIAVPDNKKSEKPKPKKTKEQLEAEKKAKEEELRRKEAERLAREANDMISGAFGKGTTMQNQGTADKGSGVEGALEGNDNEGVKVGTGGYGTFDLNGRSLGKGGLPRPTYNVQDEGRVVVNITVNSQGRVIQTSINGRTNTANAELRKAALKAASQAVFNEVSGVNNQSGTITYYFKLK